MSKQGSVQRTIYSSHPPSLLPLRCLASIVGADNVVFSDEALPSPNSSNSANSANSDVSLRGGEGGEGGGSLQFSTSTEMIVRSFNPLLGRQLGESVHVIRGYGDVARAICRLAPELGLWGSLSGSAPSSIIEAQIESWVSTSISSLMGPAYSIPDSTLATNLSNLQAQITDFANLIESHLMKSISTFGSGGTFLVGDLPTAADVIVSMLMGAAIYRTGLHEEDASGNVYGAPQQVVRWMGTMLNNPAMEGLVGKEVVVPKEGEASVVPAVPKAPAATTAPSSAAPTASVPANTPTSAPSVGPSSDAADATSSDLSSNPLLQKLTSLSIPHVSYPHTLSTTAEELVLNVPLPDPSTESHTKNLFLRDKKHGIFLVTTSTDAEVNTKELGRALKLEGKVNLRLADEELLMAKLGCKRGCVGPLAMANNVEKDVVLVLDEGLLSKRKVHSHPLRNDASVAMSPEDLMRYLKEVGVEPVVIPFPTKGAGGAGETEKLTEKLPGKVPSSRPEGPKSSTKPHIDPKPKDKDKQAKDKPSKSSDPNKKATKKGETQLALKWSKSENFPMWYSDVIVLSEMISYYDISGCYILRPWSYKIWELIQDWFNLRIRELGVENSYFPMFVSKDRLEKEKDHVEGFAPEVAWVTKSGEGDLAAPIAVRPTSETIMYPAFADWIRSHRDLPLKLNQWSNVVRWEFKDPTPFLRTREFLWQEGHTAHGSYEDADVMVRQALDLYRRVYEELLAVPVIPGYKTEKEKFAGGHQTTTVEAYVPISGRAIQGATSHNLGQNFGKMFDINYQDEKGDTQIAWQTSWGLTTRTIGVMVMVHGDDVGLVLPPRIAALQAVIIPIVSKSCPLENLSEYCENILTSLENKGVRSKLDDRLIYNPGWKYAHWEQKGVPIRIEVGPRDLEKSQARMVVRFGGEKIDVAVSSLAETVLAKLEEVQTCMFEKAKSYRDDHLVKVTEWKDFVPNLELHNLVLTPWCGGEHQEWEEWVKEKSREESLKNRVEVGGEGTEDARAATSVAAKTLCIPFDQPEMEEGMKCIASGLPAKCWVLWGRSY